MPTVLESAIGNNADANSSNGVFTPEEARELFEKTARQYVSMSGDEFLRIWDSQSFDPSLKARFMRVAVLIPLIRRTSARKKAR
jgi:hypothetical protein